MMLILNKIIAQTVSMCVSLLTIIKWISEVLKPLNTYFSQTRCCKKIFNFNMNLPCKVWLYFIQNLLGIFIHSIPQRNTSGFEDLGKLKLVKATCK